MLKSLHMENAAVIKNCDVEFAPGFNVLTGETGAGKSVLIDCIGLVLGSKASKSTVRTGEEKASVSALFCDIGDCLPEGTEFSEDENGEFYVTRTVDTSGRSSSKINGRAVSASLHRETVVGFAGMHGQNDSLTLLSPSTHTDFVDSYGNTAGTLEEYKSAYGEVMSLRREIGELTRDSREKERLSELLKLELEDINSAKLKKGEEEELNLRLEKLKNSEKILKHANFIVRTLYKSEKGVPACELTKRAAASIEAIGEYFPDREKYIKSLEEINYRLEEIALVAEDIAGEECEDPEKEIDRIEGRLDKISKLKKKYGDSIDEILDYRDKTVEKLNGLEDSEARITELNAKLKTAEKKASEISETLTEKRRNAASKLEGEIASELQYLEMPKARFKVSVTKLFDENGKPRFTPSGADSVEFMFSANPGEEMKPLASVASGGELSRVMLALRTVATDGKKGETLIFDEIDTGVSGRTSHKIGIRLRRLARSNQVICVTHSAQIAAEADCHFLIKKSEKGGRVETEVYSLDREGRINEMSRIMGGVNITEKIRLSAEEMLTSAESGENE